jgi:hemolysin III
VGAGFKIARFDRASRLGAAMYIAMGWSGLALVPGVWDRGGATAVVLLLGGGIVYTVGAAAFARQWPTLRPSTFSYHEVWHAHTITAAALHFGAVATLVT